MAKIPLKEIKFPDLADTYTIPQVDNTLTTSGDAADAKKTGDEIDALKEDLSRSLGYGTKSFNVTSGHDHSSKNDQISISIRSGDTFTIFIEGENAPSSVQVFGYLGSTGTDLGSIYFNTGYKSFTANANFDRIGLYTSNNNSDYSVTFSVVVATGLVSRVNELEDLTQLVPKVEKVVTLGKEDAGWNLLKKTNDANNREDADGTRIRIVFFVPFDNIHVTAQCSYGSGLSVSIYYQLSKAIEAGGSSSYQQTLRYSYTTEMIDGVFENGGYISISQKKTDGTTFTAEERAAAFEALNLSITYNTGESYIEDNANNIEGFAKGVERLYVGELINGHLTASGVLDDTYTKLRLSTPTVVALPCGSKRKIKVHINPPYSFAMRVGARADNLNQNLYWYEEGDIITIPDGYNYYAISIARSIQPGQTEGAVITPKELVNIGLSLEYLCNDGDVNERNAEPSKILSNAMLASLSGYKTQSKYALIGHTSDPHADYKRVDNFLSFCDQNMIDVACVTGDIVGYDPKQGIDWYHELINKYDVLSAFCAGNHDVYSSTMEDDDIYDFMFDNVAEKIGNTTGKTWYYTDISAKKIRVISVNLYQYGGESRWYTHFTDDQLSWLVSTMASTPNDYGIIILAHAPQVSLDTAKDSNYGAFYQDERLYNNTHNSVSGGIPIYDIVDAFISRTTLSKTYTQTGSPSSVSVTADFTGVDSSVEFIAHLTGHFHQDTICYVPSRTNKQLMLNVTCTNAIYGGSTYPYLADIQDQGRSNMDVTQDAFNVYVIDRDNKTVKVVRIGNTLTYQMAERKYMEIPYAD